MTDRVETALRAIEGKYLPQVMEGKSLMPFYPREDVRIMIEAASKASADKIAMVLSEELVGVDPKDIAYVAVRLAEMAERGELQPA